MATFKGLLKKGGPDRSRALGAVERNAPRERLFPAMALVGGIRAYATRELSVFGQLESGDSFRITFYDRQ